MGKINSASLLLLVLLAQGCVYLGDRTPEVNACDSWQANNTSTDWLQRKASISEVESYLSAKSVSCSSEILAAFKREFGSESEMWLFSNPGNSKPAVSEGYALIIKNKVALSFYKIW